MNVIEMVGALGAGIITVAIVALVFAPGSTAPAFITAGGKAFTSSVKAATLKG